VTFGVSSSGRLGSMKKAKKGATGELRPQYQVYDFSGLVRGKYVGRLGRSSNVVVLEPEVARLFPNAAAVNAALRSLAEIAKRAGSPARGPRDPRMASVRDARPHMPQARS
jgi:hypothetical protein